MNWWHVFLIVVLADALLLIWNTVEIRRRGMTLREGVAYSLRWWAEKLGRKPS